MRRNVFLNTGTSSAGKSKVTIAEVNLLGSRLGFEIEHMSDLPRITAAQLIGLEEPMLTCQNLDLPLLISDEECIRAATILDHLRHFGFHHTHPDEAIWDLDITRDRTGLWHLHNAITRENELPSFPFTVKDSWIPDKTAEFFWWAVLNAPTDGVVIAELARGSNGFPPGSEFAGVDFSNKTMANRLVDENLPPEERLPLAALNRIRACFWVQASFDTRLFRAREYRQFRDDTITTFFAEDDFYHFQPLLEAHNIPVLPIDNDSDQTYPEGILQHLENELARQGYPEIVLPLLQELQETRAEMRETTLPVLPSLTKEVVW